MLLSEKFILSCLLALLAFSASCRGSDQSQDAPFPFWNAVVSGNVTYEDKEYGSSGFTSNTTLKPVRRAAVEIVDAGTNAVLGKGITGADGSYSISFSFSNPTVYVRVLSDASFAGVSLLRVRNYSGAVYAVGGGDIVVTNGGAATFDLAISIAAYPSAAGAFNILDVLTSGFEFVHQLDSAYPPLLSTFWESSTYSPYDTGYCTGGCFPGAGIFINHYGYDTDGFDDDVIWHEFGHFVADKLSRDENPGGPHDLGQNDQDLRFSWSEGWGNFMPLAIKYWLHANYPERLSVESATNLLSRYVDTDYGGYFISFEFGSLFDGSTNQAPYFEYASNEVSVAYVLWHFLTETSGLGMQTIWDVFRQDIPLQTPANLEAFWNGVVGRVDDVARQDALRGFLRDCLIAYEEDVAEGAGGDDSTVSSVPLVLNTPQDRYLYKNSGMDDLDYFSISATSGTTYEITTTNVWNGGDTLITIYRPDGTTIVNDNPSNVLYVSGVNYDYYWFDYSLYSWIYEFPANDGATLSSKVVFTAAVSGDYFIEVRTSPNRPKTAGRYGRYRITATAP